MNNLLFIYGSLLNSGNEFAGYLNNNSRFYNAGKFKGRLYDIGEYPGAITDLDDEHEVKGNIYLLDNPEEALIILDDYEGYGIRQQQPNLFVRHLLPIETPDGSIMCWVYLYNLPVNGLVQITSGDYLDYLTKRA